MHLAFKNVDSDGSGFQANVEGARNVAQAAIGAGARMVSLSTAGVYGHGAHADVNEDTALSPDTPLSRSRAAADQLLMQMGLPLVILRQRFVYGPGDRAVLPRIHRAASTFPVWVDGGRARLSLLFVDDLAAIIDQAVKLPLSDLGPVFHVTDGRPVTLRELGERLCALLGGSPPRLSVPLPLLYGPIRLWERIRGQDPETSASPVSSIRLRLAAQDQVFSNRRLRAWLPDLDFTPLPAALEQSRDWYAQPRTGTAA